MQKKAFDKIQHPFIIKILTKLDRGNIAQQIKAIYDKLTANMVPNAKSLSAKILKKTRMPTLTTSIQHSIGTPSHSNQTRKRNKRYPNWKGRGKIVIIFRWHDTIYTKLLRLHTKTTQTDKWIYQGSGMQD